MRRALLIGINAYPDSPLKGCVNDATDMAEFLVGKCGFKESEIRLLTDKRATAAAMKERLQWLVKGAKAGDTLIYLYSGHGAQCATRDKAGELDGLDEVSCPVSFDWSDKEMVRDKDYYSIFSSVPKGVTFIWISDSCHSGDLTRDMIRYGTLTKAIPVPADLQWRLKIARAKELKAKKAAPLNNVVLISGCRSDQTSADATFNGRPNGALTFYLLKALKSRNGLKLSFEQLTEKVVKDLRLNGYSQIPQLEGPEALTSLTFGA